MQEHVKFPKTMAALATVEGTVWSIVDALVAEVETVGKSNRAKVGTFPAISKEAAANGFVNPTGDPYSSNVLKQYFAVGVFIRKSGTRASEFRAYPVSRVAKAIDKAGGDPGRALEILATGKTMTEIQGRTLVTGVKTREQVSQLVKAASPELRKAMVEEAMIDPDVARSVASDERMQETFIHARLDDTYRKATGKPIRPLPTEPEEEPEEGLTRPGLAFLAIGTHLYKAEMEIIGATGQANGADITDSLGRLITARVEVLRELLTDLQLVIEGQKELTDEDIAAFLKRADNDKDQLEKEVK